MLLCISLLSLFSQCGSGTETIALPAKPRRYTSRSSNSSSSSSSSSSAVMYAGGSEIPEASLDKERAGVSVEALNSAIVTKQMEAVRELVRQGAKINEPYMECRLIQERTRAGLSAARARGKQGGTKDRNCPSKNINGYENSLRSCHQYTVYLQNPTNIQN
jgi:hypothetical protein